MMTSGGEQQQQRRRYCVTIGHETILDYGHRWIVYAGYGAWQPLREAVVERLVDDARRDAVPLLLRVINCELPPVAMLRPLLCCADGLEAKLHLDAADMSILSQCVRDSTTLRDVRIVNLSNGWPHRSITQDMVQIFRECPNVVRIVGLDICGEFSHSNGEECSRLAYDRIGLIEFDMRTEVITGGTRRNDNQDQTRRVVALNHTTAEILRCAPELGDGQYADSGGDLQLLPNELLCMVAAALPTAADVLRLGWTCRLLRDCAMCNYVACLRHDAVGIDCRWTYRAAYAVHDADYIWCKYH
jgi:hypothetical protein